MKCIKSLYLKKNANVDQLNLLKYWVMEYELQMYMIKFALTCKTFTSLSNSKTHSNRYKNNCLCVKKKTLTINSQLGTCLVFLFTYSLKTSKCRSRRSYYQKYTTGELSFSPRYCIKYFLINMLILKQIKIVENRNA